MGSFVNWDTLSTSKFGNLDFSSFSPQQYYLTNYKNETFSPGSGYNQQQIQNNAGKFRSVFFNAGGKNYVFVPEDYVNRGVVEGNTQYVPINVIRGNNIQELSKNSEYVDLSNSALGNEAASKGFSAKGYLFPSGAKTSDGKELSSIFADPVGQSLEYGNITGISKVGDQYVYATDRKNGYVDQAGYGHWTNEGGGNFLGDLFKDLGPIGSIVLAVIAPEIGIALGLEGTAAAVVGSAITNGVLAEAQGGDFIDGAIKGAVSAGVAPTVANAVGQSVANVMADSAVKNVVSNAIASSAASATTAALTGGDVEAAAKQGLAGGALGSAGRDIATAAAQGTDPFSQQTQMLAAQEQGLGTAGAFGSQLGQAAGAIGLGADPLQALVGAAGRYGQEMSAATPTAGFTGPVQQAPIQQAFVPGAENVAQMLGGGAGDVLAGPGQFTTKTVEAMPQMQPREGETAGPVTEQTEEGITTYKREITGATKDGKPYSYIVSYDPENINKPIRYEYSLGERIGLASVTRPNFETEGAGGAATTGEVAATTPSTFIQEPVDILGTIAAGRGDISKGETLTPSAITAPGGVSAGVPTSDFGVPLSFYVPGTTPSADQMTVVGPMDTSGRTGGQTGLPSTQEITIPDQISQVLGGGIGGTGGTLTGGGTAGAGTTAGGPGGGPGGTDTLIGGGAVVDTLVGAGPGGTDTLIGGGPGGTDTLIGAGPGGTDTLIGGGPGGADTLTGGLTGTDTLTGDLGTDTLIGGTSTEPPDKKIVDPEDTTTEVTPTPYIRDFYISGGYQPKTMGPTVRTLGQALSPPLFPTAPVSGLTSYRGAGEIEGQQTGKQRRNVWNEASLRLKDALGL